MTLKVSTTTKTSPPGAFFETMEEGIQKWK